MRPRSAKLVLLSHLPWRAGRCRLALAGRGAQIRLICAFTMKDESIGLAAPIRRSGVSRRSLLALRDPTGRGHGGTGRWPSPTAAHGTAGRCRGHPRLVFRFGRTARYGSLQAHSNSPHSRSPRYGPSSGIRVSFSPVVSASMAPHAASYCSCPRAGFPPSVIRSCPGPSLA